MDFIIEKSTQHFSKLKKKNSGNLNVLFLVGNCPVRGFFNPSLLISHLLKVIMRDTITSRDNNSDPNWQYFCSCPVFIDSVFFSFKDLEHSKLSTGVSEEAEPTSPFNANCQGKPKDMTLTFTRMFGFFV